MTKLYRNQQAGVALISVLLVFALAAVIAAEVMSRQYRDIRKTANFINGKQAYHFALSGEQYARQILYRDFDEQREDQYKSDTFSDIWADNLPIFDIEGGEMKIQILDLQGRLNINRVPFNNRDEFSRLDDILDLQSDYTDRVIDWIDANKIPEPQGAEDIDYSDGLLPANRPLGDVSELLMIRDMAIPDYLKLRPLLTALPEYIGEEAVGETKYNINTVNAKLLEAIADLSASEAQQVVDQQQRGGYENINNWYSGAVGAKLYNRRSLFAVSSSFFEIVVTVNFQQSVAVLTTKLYRDPGDGKITIINRQLGNAASAATRLASL